MKTIYKVIVIVISILIFKQAIAGPYKKESQETGFKIQLNIEELAAVNFIFPEVNANAVINGASGTNNTVTFSGKNHNLDGTLANGEKPALRLNLAENVLNINAVTLEGSPEKDANFQYSLDINAWSIFLRKNAHIVITKDSTFQNTTIGTPSDYKIVYVNNARITLGHNFKGYGILYIEDKSEKEPILTMRGNARWEGIIILNQSQTENNNSKIYLEGGPEIDIHNFALLGIESLIAGNNMSINSGMIGAYPQGGNVTLGNNAYLAQGIVADIINVGNNVTVNNNIYFNTQFTHGDNFIHNGEEISPLDFPFTNLPEFPEFEAGTKDINIGNNTNYVLSAGNYKKISLGNNATLYLTGGIYNIENFSAGNNSQVIYEAASEVRVKEKVKFGNTPAIKPASETVSPSDCIFYIEGAQYPYFEEVFHYDDDVFIAGNQPKIYCNIYAPNSNVRIGNNGDYKGAIIAKKITSGNNPCTTMELDSAFSSPLSYVEIYGSVLCYGSTFYIPDSGKNAKILYSQEALEKVNKMLNSLPSSWTNWKEVK